MVNEKQKKAVRLKEEIENACIRQGLNLTIYDGGIGFVDPKENKIVMVWRPQFKSDKVNETRMMERLIKADSLKDRTSEYALSEDEYRRFCKIIDAEPTAFDLDKVLEQLRDEEELSYADFEIYAEEHGLSEDDDWHHRGLGRAVEIVKRGGTDGKIN